MEERASRRPDEVADLTEITISYSRIPISYDLRYIPAFLHLDVSKRGLNTTVSAIKAPLPASAVQNYLYDRPCLSSAFFRIRLQGLWLWGLNILAVESVW